MSKGSLQDSLHSSEGTSELSLLQRINILMGVAFALDYIHNHCIPVVVHGDLKPSNILLDDDMVAHVGDFGLTRLLGTSCPNSSTGFRGTIGYVAPEYGLGNEMSSSGDVCSFGILLLEVMTRKKPTDDIFKESLNLHKIASMALPDRVMDVIDVNMLNVYEENENFIQNMEENVKKIEECLAFILRIGISCNFDSPLEMMDMKRVVQELQHILDTLQNI
ncbi:receptor kinase-like protein Xa21 [Bidens hawaiensis]|uniref:receptor kinase-like protein Xa21 n=1 Tax=Bidens hawaiensis TaxID=980011 RepID=UPI0040496638